MRRTEDKLPAVPTACTVLTKSKICLRMRMTGIQLKTTPLIATVLLYLTCQKSDICLRMRRTKGKLPAVPTACTLLMKSKICLHMRMTGIQLKTTPLIATVLLYLTCQKSDICLRIRRPGI
jgi:hypothetical protein